MFNCVITSLDSYPRQCGALSLPFRRTAKREVSLGFYCAEPAGGEAAESSPWAGKESILERQNRALYTYLDYLSLFLCFSL